MPSVAVGPVAEAAAPLFAKARATSGLGTVDGGLCVATTL